jgi:pyridoxal phosphate enzyme (YggS family)
MSIIQNYNNLQNRVKSICSQCGRDESDVLILPVSKTFPIKILQDALNSGLTLFGENKVQEAKEKHSILGEKATFHLIGHLQSNKAKVAVKVFDLIHSIDKVSTARKVGTAALAIGKVQDILVQVNTSGESTKSGVAINEAVMFADEISRIDGLNLSGLMTIGPLSSDKEEIRKSFASLKQIKEEIESHISKSLQHLSMGMSGDFDIAIEEGATIIRVGSAIFGHRDYGKGDKNE